MLRVVTAVALLLLPGHRAAADELSVVTRPDPLVLGRASQMEFLVEGLPGEGPVAGDANVGEVMRVDPQGDAIRVTYRPPRALYPQTLCLALWRVNGGIDTPVRVVRLPLLGQTRIPVRTSKGAVVRIDIGGREYGPVTTEARGSAEVPVLVPPGAGAARVEVTDAAGMRSERSIAVAQPGFNQLAMAITPTRVAGAAGARFRIVLAAAAAEAADPPRLEVEERRLELRRTGPGKWSAVWAPGSRPAGRVLIRAHIPGDLESERFAELGITPSELTVHVHRGRPPRALSSGRGRLSGAIGLALGMTHNLGELVAPRFGLELGLEYRLSLGFVGARLLAGYGWATQRVSAPGALPDADSTVMLVPLGGALSYRAPLPYLTPYVMWGCLAQVVRTSNRAPYLTPERKRTDVVFAVLAVAGASRRLGPGRLFLQLGYQWSKVENEDVDALAGGMILEGGWRLEL